jgi:hypothetical protein
LSEASALSRPGIRVLDWNATRHAHGPPGSEIGTLFSLVVGDERDPSAARFVHARMDPSGPPRLWHSHPGWTTTIVLKGSLDIEGVTFAEGQMVVVAPNVGYGPLTAGPEGATFLEIFSDGAATKTAWDEDDPRVTEYRARGWIIDAPPAPPGTPDATS